MGRRAGQDKSLRMKLLAKDDLDLDPFDFIALVIRLVEVFGLGEDEKLSSETLDQAGGGTRREMDSPPFGLVG
jgi:hypothetical protein